MPKTIVLFADGTGNSSAGMFKTNVWRMYEAVDHGPCPPDKRPQLAYYADGVGTSGFRPLALLGGAFGLGLKRNVLDIYKYVCRNYREGDDIYAFGFSRGAFTIRLLVSMMASEGLVPATSEAALDTQSRSTYRQFRSHFLPRRLRWPTHVLRRLRNVADRLFGNEGGKSSNIYPTIRFVGVWDTVSAYGGPTNTLTRAIDNWVYSLHLPGYVLHERIECARHALALDDAREAFHPILWDEGPERDLVEKGIVSPDRLQQVWFAGMHADVGGGYPDDSLSYVPLLWMLEEAQKVGLRTLNVETDKFVAAADSYGPMHDSRAGLGLYYRYQPRRLAAWLEPGNPATLSLCDPVMADDEGHYRGQLRSVQVHESVVGRIENWTDGYAPLGLPESFTVVPARDERNEPARSAGSAARIAVMERAWDLVWWRQRVYALTIILTSLLLVLPFIAGRLPALPRTRVSSLINLVTPRDPELFALPSVARIWLDGYIDNPFYFLALAFLLTVSIRYGAGLERTVSDVAHAAWNAEVSGGHAGKSTVSWTQRLRTNRFYQRLQQLVTWSLLPDFVMAPMMMQFGLWLALAAYAQTSLEIVERISPLCESSSEAGDLTIAQREFRPRDLCSGSFGRIHKGMRYAVQFDVVEPWADGTIATSPLGLGRGEYPLLQGYLLTPFLRVLDGRILQPVMKIVESDHASRRWGRSMHLASLSLHASGDRASVYQGEFVAEAGGELFLFANDAMIPTFGKTANTGYFYEGASAPANRGTACVTVERFDGPHEVRIVPPAGSICQEALMRSSPLARANEREHR